MSQTNGIATAADFEQLMEFSEPQRVILPKLGKPVMMRRPTPMWMMFHGRLPMTMAAKMARTNGETNKAEDIVESAEWMFRLANAVMVQPRCVMEPNGSNEISPDMIHLEDMLFIMRWAVGEEVDEAKSLDTFRAERGTAHTGAPS